MGLERGPGFLRNPPREARRDGSEAVRFTEERAPAWVGDGSVSGKRWYHPRLRGS